MVVSEPDYRRPLRVWVTIHFKRIPKLQVSSAHEGEFNVRQTKNKRKMCWLPASRRRHHRHLTNLCFVWCCIEGSRTAACMGTDESHQISSGHKNDWWMGTTVASLWVSVPRTSLPCVIRTNDLVSSSVRGEGWVGILKKKNYQENH